jgi:hypothetical protein
MNGLAQLYRFFPSLPLKGHSRGEEAKNDLYSERCTICEGTVPEAIRETARAKLAFTEDDIYARGQRTLERAIGHGTQYMRAHTEIGTPADMDKCWSMIGRSAAALMNIKGYGIEVGHAADFLIIGAPSPASAIAEIRQPMAGYKSGIRTFTRPDVTLHRPI